MKKKNLIKFLDVAMALVLSFSAFTGCSSGKDEYAVPDYGGGSGYDGGN